MDISRPEQRAILQLLGTIIRRSPGPSPVPEPEIAFDDVLPNFIAAAPATRKLKNEVLRLSRSNATILIRGESGSGVGPAFAVGARRFR